MYHFQLLIFLYSFFETLRIFPGWVNSPYFSKQWLFSNIYSLASFIKEASNRGQIGDTSSKNSMIRTERCWFLFTHSGLCDFLFFFLGCSSSISLSLSFFLFFSPFSARPVTNRSGHWKQGQVMKSDLWLLISKLEKGYISVLPEGCCCCCCCAAPNDFSFSSASNRARSASSLRMCLSTCQRKHKQTWILGSVFKNVPKKPDLLTLWTVIVVLLTSISSTLWNNSCISIY